MTLLTSIAYPSPAVYLQISKLLSLLAYAATHSHSAAWIPALLKILERKVVAHG